MPIDASIALQGRPPVYEPIAAAQQRQMTLRNLAQQHDMGAQALDAGGLKIEQERLAVQRDAAYRKAIADSVNPPAAQPAQDQSMQIVAPPIPGVPGGGVAPPPAAPGLNPQVRVKDQNIDGLVNTLRSQGLGPEADNLIKSYNENQAKRALADKDFSEGAKFRQDTEDKKHKFVGQSLDAINALPPSQRPAAYTATVRKLEAAGYVKPGDEPDQYPGDAAFAQMRDTFLTHEEKMAAAKDVREAELQPSAVAQSQAKAVTEGVQAQQMTDLGMTQQQKDELDRQTKANEEAARHNRVDENLGGGRLRVAQGELSVTQQRQADSHALITGVTPGGAPGASAATGSAFLSTLPPARAAQVQAIAEGRQTALPRGKELTALMDAVNQYDPSYSKERASMRHSFLSGKQGDNIGALNTASVHLGRWYDAMQAQKNGTFQPGNEAFNYIAQKFGLAATTNTQFVSKALAGEAATALKGNATDPEIAHVLSTLKPDLSPDQSLGVAKEGLRIFGDKLNTADERYHALSGPDDQWSPVLPSAKAVFDRFGVNPIARTSTPAAGGSLPTGKGQVLDKPTAQKFYQAAGGDPVKAKKLAESAGWKVQ